MKKTKRILAIIGIVLLASLYLSALLFAFIDKSASLVFLKTSIGATIFFPVILYAMTIVYKHNSNNNRSFDDDTQASEDSSDESL